MHALTDGNYAIWLDPKGPYPAEESAIDSADFTAQSADSTADSMIVGRLALSNMFNILNPL